MSEVRFKNGRDAELEVESIGAGEPSTAKGRCQSVYNTLQAFTNKRIIGILDWKGCLTIVWSEKPGLLDVFYAQRAWYRECECQIQHAFYSHDRYHGLECEVGDTATCEDPSFELGHLGLA